MTEPTEPVITIELSQRDSVRLLWLVQKEAATGRIWDDYWAKLAAHIRANIDDDVTTAQN